MPRSFYTLESLEANNSVGFLIKRCGIAMAQITERRFEFQQISFIKWMALMLLTQRPRASPTELSAHLGHSMGALTRVVDELENEGMVRRDRSLQDRRAVEIEITTEGRRVALAGKRLMVDLLNDLVDPFSKMEVETLISLLGRLLLRLQDARRSALSNGEGTASGQSRNRRRAHTQPKRSRATHTTLRRKRVE